MATAQPGIFALGNRSHYYLEFDLAPGADPTALVGSLAALREPRQTIAGANIVVGLAPSLWTRVAPGETPAGAHDFRPVVGEDGFEMPATQHSAWVWVSAAGYDTVFDVARAAVVAVGEGGALAEHRSGFSYRDSRDLTGFEDGTENPPLDEAPAVVVVPGGSPAAGASIALVQRWEHDLGAFHALDPADQERVFGRTKADSVELDGPDRPEDSDVARVVIEEDGDELEILRRSSSYGDVADHGLVFVGFTNRIEVTDRMLARMVGSEGRRDRLTFFSTPRTGAYYVVPSLEALRRFAEPAG